MLGYDMRVIRNGQIVEGLHGPHFPYVTGGEIIYSFLPTGLGRLPVSPIDLMEKYATRVACADGYPILFTMRAGDFPQPFDIPDDEIVIVMSWDQS